MPELKKFKDFNIGFKPHPVTADLMVVKDSADIKQSIKNLLLTRKGERLFNYNIGTSLADLLFEPADYGTADTIRDEIKVILNNYEKRISLLELSVDINFDDNGYDISLIYEIIGRSELPVNLEFFLESTR